MAREQSTALTPAQLERRIHDDVVASLGIVESQPAFAVPRLEKIAEKAHELRAALQRLDTDGPAERPSDADRKPRESLIGEARAIVDTLFERIEAVEHDLQTPLVGNFSDTALQLLNILDDRLKELEEA